MKHFSPFQLSIVALALLIGGCANPYQKFYHANPTLAVSTNRPVPFSGEPEVLAGSDNRLQDVLRMYEQGYMAVGSSDFVGGPQGRAGAIAEAKKLGAAKVLLYSKYSNTVNGVMPLTLPTATTSYSSGTVNAFGPGGYGTGNYSGMTTTYGTQTTYIPYSVDKYEQHAIYFALTERTGLGVLSKPLNDAEKQSLGSNKGMMIVAIRLGSPAFKADLLPRDILISVQGEEVYDFASLRQAYEDAKGHDVQVVVFREGKRITKTVDVPSGEW